MEDVFAQKQSFNLNVQAGVAGQAYKQQEPSIASSIDRLRLTAKQAEEIREKLEQIVNTLRPGPVGRSGSASDGPKQSGTIADLNSVADSLGNTFGDINTLIARVQVLHG